MDGDHHDDHLHHLRALAHTYALLAVAPSPQRRQTEQGTLQIHQPRTRLIRQRLCTAAPQGGGPPHGDHIRMPRHLCRLNLPYEGCRYGVLPHSGQRPHRSGSAAPDRIPSGIRPGGDLLARQPLAHQISRNRGKLLHRGTGKFRQHVRLALRQRPAYHQHEHPSLTLRQARPWNPGNRGIDA